MCYIFQTFIHFLHVRTFLTVPLWTKLDVGDSQRGSYVTFTYQLISNLMSCEPILFRRGI